MSPAHGLGPGPGKVPLNGGFINGLMADLAGWLNFLAQRAKEGA